MARLKAASCRRLLARATLPASPRATSHLPFPNLFSATSNGWERSVNESSWRRIDSGLLPTLLGRQSSVQVKLRFSVMSRKCSTCQHVKRAEIDRRLAGGEPGKQVALDYGLNPSSLHRHRVNCLKLGSSNAIMREVARGTAAVACLPSRNDLGSAYSDLRAQLDQIVGKAVEEGQPKTAITGLNSMRQTLDSLMRLAGHDRPTA